MGCSCNLFGRVISVTSPKTLDGGSGRSSKPKKKCRRRSRGGHMDEEEDDSNVDYRCSPHPALPPACHASQTMARSVIYSNDSPVVVVQAPVSGYSYIPAPPTSSYAYAASGAPSAVVVEQQAPAPSKSRVRFSLPGGSGRHSVDEPVVANPVGATTVETYYPYPQHDQHQVAQVQQHSSSHHKPVVRHDDTGVAGPAVCGTDHTAPLQFVHPAVMATPEYGLYNYSYATPRREAVYRIGTDANRFSMFSDENPNACSIV